MIDPSPFLGQNPLTVTVPPGALRAGLALAGGVGGMVTALLLTVSIAASGGREAERIADARGEGYGVTFATALAAHLSKPLR